MADTLTARGAPAPSAPAVPSTFTFDAIGTRWCVDTDEPLRGEVRDWILDRIRRFDRTYSRFRPDSLVARVAAANLCLERELALLRVKAQLEPAASALGFAGSFARRQRSPEQPATDGEARGAQAA